MGDKIARMKTCTQPTPYLVFPVCAMCTNPEITVWLRVKLRGRCLYSTRSPQFHPQQHPLTAHP